MQEYNQLLQALFEHRQSKGRVSIISIHLVHYNVNKSSSSKNVRHLIMDTYKCYSLRVYCNNVQLLKKLYHKESRKESCHQEAKFFFFTFNRIILLFLFLFPFCFFPTQQHIGPVKKCHFEPFQMVSPVVPEIKSLMKYKLLKCTQDQNFLK